MLHEELEQLAAASLETAGRDTRAGLMQPAESKNDVGLEIKAEEDAEPRAVAAEPDLLNALENHAKAAGGLAGHLSDFQKQCLHASSADFEEDLHADDPSCLPDELPDRIGDDSTSEAAEDEAAAALLSVIAPHLGADSEGGASSPRDTGNPGRSGGNHHNNGASTPAKVPGSGLGALAQALANANASKRMEEGTPRHLKTWGPASTETEKAPGSAR